MDGVAAMAVAHVEIHAVHVQVDIWVQENLVGANNPVVNNGGVPSTAGMNSALGSGLGAACRVALDVHFLVMAQQIVERREHLATTRVVLAVVGLQVCQIRVVVHRRGGHHRVESAVHGVCVEEVTILEVDALVAQRDVVLQQYLLAEPGTHAQRPPRDATHSLRVRNALATALRILVQRVRARRRRRRINRNRLCVECHRRRLLLLLREEVRVHVR